MTTSTDATASAIMRVIDDLGGGVSVSGVMSILQQVIEERIVLPLDLAIDDMTSGQQKDTASALDECSKILKAYATDFRRAAKTNFY